MAPESGGGGGGGAADGCGGAAGGGGCGRFGGSALGGCSGVGSAAPFLAVVAGRFAAPGVRGLSSVGLSRSGVSVAPAWSLARIAGSGVVLGVFAAGVQSVQPALVLTGCVVGIDPTSELATSLCPVAEGGSSRTFVLVSIFFLAEEIRTRLAEILARYFAVRAVGVWGPSGAKSLASIVIAMMEDPLAILGGAGKASDGGFVGDCPRSAVSVASLLGALSRDEFTGWVRFLVACLAVLVEGAAPACGLELQISSRSAAAEALRLGSTSMEMSIGRVGLLVPLAAPPTCRRALPIWRWTLRWSVLQISLGVHVVSAVGAGPVITKWSESPRSHWVQAIGGTAECPHSVCVFAPVVIHMKDKGSVVCPQSLCGYAPFGESAPIGDLHPLVGAAHRAPGACWDAPSGDRSMPCVVQVDGVLVPTTGVDTDLVADLSHGFDIPNPLVFTCLDYGSFLIGSGGGDASPRSGK